MTDQEISYEDLYELLLKGQNYLKELKDTKLNDIRVPVRDIHPAVLDAIRNLFGEEYISSDNTSYVTFEMFLRCMEISRNVGRATAAEFV